MPICKKCNKEKDDGAFPIERGTYKGKTYAYRQHTCRDCYNLRQKEKHLRHREQNLARMASKYQSAKDKVFAHYGCVCACCGEDKRLFLNVDHENNDGYKYRKNGVKNIHSNIYQWLVSHKFPEGYQILCYNCNIGKKHNKGICPHVCQEGSTIIPSGSTAQAIGAGST